MQTLLKTDFHGAAPTDALRLVIGNHLEQLEHIFARLIACHVTVKAPGHHHRSGDLYEVHIRLNLPDGAEINVGHLPRSDPRQSDAVFAVGDAFRRTRRRLTDHVRHLRSQARTHET